MLIHIIVNENETGERNVLGAFTNHETAVIKAEEYSLENPAEECWIESFDTEEWPYEAAEYKMIHRTMIGKTTNLTSHVIVFTKEEVPLLEEGEEWYIIQQENTSFDREEGLERNRRLLQVYLQGKKGE